MKTANTSKSSVTATDEIRAAAEQLGGLRNTMRFLVPLTEAEREQQRNGRIGVTKLRLIAKRLEAARQNRDHLPPAFELRKFEHDADQTGSLAELLAVVDALRGDVHDSLLVAANRAAVAANSVYGYIRVGSDTAERLKRTVENITRRSARSSAAEPPATPEAAAAGKVPSTPPTPGTAPPATTEPAAKVESAPQPTAKAA